MRDAERLFQALEYLSGSAHALLEANKEDIECRADEDCDHCCFVAALHEADKALADDRKESAK